eukprot:4288585-Amphidinium_carterae.1
MHVIKIALLFSFITSKTRNRDIKVDQMLFHTARFMEGVQGSTVICELRMLTALPHTAHSVATTDCLMTNGSSVRDTRGHTQGTDLRHFGHPQTDVCISILNYLPKFGGFPSLPRPLLFRTFDVSTFNLPKQRIQNWNVITPYDMQECLYRS